MEDSVRQARWLLWPPFGVAVGMMLVAIFAG